MREQITRWESCQNAVAVYLRDNQKPDTYGCSNPKILETHPNVQTFSDGAETVPVAVFYQARTKPFATAIRDEDKITQALARCKDCPFFK
jgi:hypothetical protein